MGGYKNYNKIKIFLKHGGKEHEEDRTERTRLYPGRVDDCCRHHRHLGGHRHPAVRGVSDQGFQLIGFK